MTARKPRWRSSLPTCGPTFSVASGENLPIVAADFSPSSAFAGQAGNGRDLVPGAEDRLALAHRHHRLGDRGVVRRRSASGSPVTPSGFAATRSWAIEPVPIWFRSAAASAWL